MQYKQYGRILFENRAKEKVAFLNVYIKTTEYGMMQLHKCIVLENRNKRQQNN